MKSFVLVALLCGGVVLSTAEAVPVEAAAPEELSLPVEDLLAEVVEEEFEPDQSVEALGSVVKKSTSPLSNLERPIPFEEGEPNTNCPSGWAQNRGDCYLFVNMSYNWNNADAFCQYLGASLTSAHDLQEYSFLKQLAWKQGFAFAWIGAFQFQRFWKWDDGSPFDYTNWYSHTSYDCAYLNSVGFRGWSSTSCTQNHPFICSIRTTHRHC